MSSPYDFKGTVRPHGGRRVQRNVYAIPVMTEAEKRAAKGHVKIGGAEDVAIISSMSKQVISKKPSCGVPKFGLEDRAKASRVQFLSESHTAMNPPCSPGPASVDIKSNFNDPYLGAPSYSFGESREKIVSNENRVSKFKVGPGTHEHKPGIGTQTQSKNVSAPAYHFSRSTRKKGDKLYVPGFEREQCAKYTPGPGAHELQDSIESGAPLRKKLPSYSFAPEHFTGKPREKQLCGPGRYEAHSAIKQQYTSHRRNQPAFRFGGEKRTSGAAQAAKRSVPGVGTYDNAKSSLGKQSQSYNKIAPSFGFGTAPRKLM